MPLTTLAALGALVVLLMPTGATGAEAEGSGARDTYYFNQKAALTEPVAGTVQVYGGSLDVRAPIEGDLFVMGGRITVSEGGRIGGNLIHAASVVDAPSERIGGRMYPLTSLQGAAGAVTKTAVVVSLLLVWLLAAIVVTLMNGREIRYSSAELRASPLHCFVLGLVAITSFVLTAIAFSYLVPFVIGIPLLAALGVFAILTKVYGMIAVFHTVGILIAGIRSRRELDGRRWLRGDLAFVVLGALLLGAIRLVPVVGTFLWALAGIFGVGTALATRFGRRDPWFLAARDALAM